MKKYCLVRFDDVCPTMNWKQFYRAVELVNYYSNGKGMLGVIPQNEDPDQVIDSPNLDFWKVIKSFQNDGWTIALHGYTHVYDQEKPKTFICGVKHSEFAGNDFEIQKIKIEQGKKILCTNGIFTDVFFAPAHTYDRNTLKALNENGFKYNIDGLSRRPALIDGVINIPCRCGGIPKNANNLINIAVLHTSKMDASDFDKLELFLKKNRKYLCSFDDICRIKNHSQLGYKTNELLYRVPRTIKHKVGDLLRHWGLR